MTGFTVNLVTAFGRGETLALALEAQGFSVRVLDFTGAFGSEYRRGPGPFPLALTPHLPEQKDWLTEAVPLPRGLSFWLNEGPVELGGPMAAFYQNSRADVQALYAGTPHAVFKTDWLRRFLHQWASPFQDDSWGPARGASFPWKDALGLIPSFEEAQVLDFERFRAKGFLVQRAVKLDAVTIDGSRINEISVDGQVHPATQWVWCLSSAETAALNPPVAAQVFPKGVWAPEWSWLGFKLDCEHGPWNEGLPQHTVFLGDVCLPWVYANQAVLRGLDPEGFRVWIKVPAKSVTDEAQRRGWITELEILLNRRLALARWSVDAADWGVCPHSPTFSAAQRDAGVTPWKNWDWIAPEKLERVDFGARLAAEAKSLGRLSQWRQEQLKKQGGSRDRAVHAP